MAKGGGARDAPESQSGKERPQEEPLLHDTAVTFLDKFRKECHFCHSYISKKAIKCSHCGCFQDKWTRILDGGFTISHIPLILSIGGFILAGYKAIQYKEEVNDQNLVISEKRATIDERNQRVMDLEKNVAGLEESSADLRETIERVEAVLENSSKNVNTFNASILRQYQQGNGTTYKVRERRIDNTSYLDKLVVDGVLEEIKIKDFHYNIIHSTAGAPGSGSQNETKVLSYEYYTDKFHIDEDLLNKNLPLVGFKAKTNYYIAEVLITPLSKANNEFQIKVFPIHPVAKYHPGVQNFEFDWSLYGYFLKEDDTAKNTALENKN